MKKLKTTLLEGLGSMSKIKKAIIPAAGLGTRFFPATKTIPKEMLPIVDKPTILYVIEEAMQAGIEDIILIQGRGKTAIEDFFDITYELEQKLINDGKADWIEKINKIRNSVNIISIRQKEALGLGHAVKCGQSIVGQSPFAVLLGDEITVTENADTNVTHFLCNQYEKNNKSSVWVMPVDKNSVNKYGIVDFGHAYNQLTSIPTGQSIQAVIEKPSVDLAPSTWALPGRYVFSADIFDEIEKVKPGVNGEIQLSDAMNALAKKNQLVGCSFDARRFDAGDKLGFLIANIELALERDDLATGLRDYLKQKLKTL